MCKFLESMTQWLQIITIRDLGIVRLYLVFWLKKKKKGIKYINLITGGYFNLLIFFVLDLEEKNNRENSGNLHVNK